MTAGNYCFSAIKGEAFREKISAFQPSRAKHSGKKFLLFRQKYLPECFAPTNLMTMLSA
jgi:hypothetical protein